jgi:hypothetical protein
MGIAEHMVRHAFSAVSFLTITAACAAPGTPPAETATAEVVAPERPVREAGPRVKASKRPTTGKVASRRGRAPAKRKLGDFHVYQYSGSFAKDPVTLTEQVVAQEGDVLVVDFVLEESGKTKALRVRMKDADEIVSVVKIGQDGEKPGTLADYEALIRKTQLAPDTNDEMISSEKTACLVGDEQVECELTTYRVTFGDREARLTITRSAALPGRDIGGDVVTNDGKVLYSARLIERGNEPPVVESLARLSRLSE